MGMFWVMSSAVEASEGSGGHMPAPASMPGTLPSSPGTPIAMRSGTATKYSNPSNRLRPLAAS